MTTTLPTPVTLGLAPSFGFGDRLGLATPGHVAAMQQMLRDNTNPWVIEPIFPQQSIREMQRTSRTAVQVMNEALTAMQAAGWTGRTGADADHQKTPADIDDTAAAGFTFFTLDPSAHVDQQADGYSATQLAERFPVVAAVCPWYDKYLGRTVTLPGGTRIEFTTEVCQRAAVKYGRAIAAAIELAGYVRQVHERLGRPYEIELSVDETDQPTTLAEHYLIAEQCLLSGMPLVSLAPRFIGDFEKGVDFKGNLEQLTASLHEHAAVANALGPYKLSLHSGSDKLSMYPALAQATAGRFHVKTAGTSYLEALRVVAQQSETLFRAIITFARSKYEIDKATYHVSATLASAPAPEAITSGQGLERIYLECWDSVRPGRGFTNPGRQILHCTFGSVLTHPEFGPAVRDVVRNHAEQYTAILNEHFTRHLQALTSRPA